MIMTRKKSKLVYGWGVNDVEYPVTRSKVVSGKQKIVWVCPYYLKWRKMLERCFCCKYQARCPTYKGCAVCEEWKYLSNFIKWVDSQPNKDWQNCEPDKDLLVRGNKDYSTETIVFVSSKVNNFITDRVDSRGSYMLGVCYYMGLNKNPYLARCNNPFGGSGHLGYYQTELEAHLAWQAKKHEYACRLADTQEDERVAKALSERYAPDKDWRNK